MILFCPQCRAEYREGILECADCQRSLVAELPPQPKPQPDLELVTVLATGNPALIAVAKSLLEDSGIEYLTQNEGLHDLFPVHRFRIHIQVRQEDEGEATALLADLDEG
ncbi:MAG: DUF2007 domain-containing protein [Acidobacteria bacterium]|nr:DUF2007 domain-containing protein [Acidobacteriota bacterium]